MLFHIITLFPEMFEGVFNHSIIKRALDRKKIVVNSVNLRDYAIDKRGTVDDKPYGGGTGMLLRPEPIFSAVRDLKKTSESSKKIKVILLTPRGKLLNQKKIREFSKLDELIIICGRYEGVDERVHKKLADEEVSIGEYVLSGGEIGAMVLVDSITRLLEGVLVKPDATKNESFSEGMLKEYPQYTRPENFEGLEVPEVLLSGNHQEIEKWKKANSNQFQSIINKDKEG